MTDTINSSSPTDVGTLRLLVRFLRSVVAYVVVSLYVAIVGTTGFLLALVIRRSEFLFLLARIGVRTALFIVGIRYKVVGAENMRSECAVYCANHQSNVDPPLLFVALGGRVRALYKLEFDRIPVLARAMRHVGFVPIDRGNRARAGRSIERAAALVRDGLTFMVYPEGTRSRTGELLPFKKGGFILAILAQAPIIPVSVTGAREAMRKGSKVIHPVQVTVRIGEPIPTEGLTLDDRDALIVQVRARIEALIAEGPAQ